MRNALAWVLSAALLALPGSSPDARADQEGSKLKVGFIGSFSGAAHVYGEAARNGFELALREGANERLEVVYEDDQSAPARTVAAFNKLVDIDRVALAVTLGSTPSNAVAPLAQARGIPLIGWASSRSVARNRPLVIRSYPSGEAEGRRAVREALRRGCGRAALFVSQNDYADSWRTGVVSAFPPAALAVDHQLTGEIFDFKPLILKAQEAGAECYALCLDIGKSGLFAKQLRELKIDKPILGCEYLHDRAEVAASKQALVDAWFATVPIREEFQARYIAAFGSDSMLSAAANHYDLARLLSGAPPGLTGAALVKSLLSAGPIRGAVGEFEVREEGNDRFFDIPLVIKVVARDGYRVLN
jgi:ABC-type branched-subunit amino acid transport system substrate-binding protein